MGKLGGGDGEVGGREEGYLHSLSPSLFYRVTACTYFRITLERGVFLRSYSGYTLRDCTDGGFSAQFHCIEVVRLCI